MGAGGTALAVASSDIVLMTDSIRSIPQVGLRYIPYIIILYSWSRLSMHTSNPRWIRTVRLFNSPSLAPRA
jgi:hypothetical protein